MKYPIVVALMVVSLLATACGKKSATKDETPPYNGPTLQPSAVDGFILNEKKMADNCQVIAYASADTNHAPNIVFTVLEIWKGKRDASALGVTNGTQFSQRLGSPFYGELPAGAVVLIPQTDNPLTAFEKRQLTFIRSGRVMDMTVNEYRKRLGIEFNPR